MYGEEVDGWRVWRRDVAEEEDANAVEDDRSAERSAVARCEKREGVSATTCAAGARVTCSDF